jgi:tRNA pseudouridine55 synthase
MFGLLNIDKPTGPTSRDVVNRVARLIKPHKTGHAGTLDPLATGVLIVAVGPATRLVEYVQRMPKTYVGTFLLGRSSDTEDIQGAVIELPSPTVPTRETIAAALPQFVGTIQQQPPAYSALKIAGQRAYALSRRGEAVALAPRPVVIDEIELLQYAYPELQLRIRCGSGTYVRSLGRDIARALGTAAVMSALRRTSIGPFSSDAALNYDKLDETAIREHLQPPRLALGDMSQVTLSDSEVSRVIHGQPIPLRGGEAAAFDRHGKLIAILEERDHAMWPTKCFAK